MKQVEISQIYLDLIDLLNRAEGEDHRIVVTREGKPIAALISLGELDYLHALEDYFDATEADKALKEMEGENWISWEDCLKGEV